MSISPVGSPAAPSGTTRTAAASGNSGNFDEILMNMRKLLSPIRVRHILVKTLTEAEGIKGLLDRGADFAQLAEERSLCPSKSKGGDLGYFGPGRMVKEFEDASFSLDQEGDISDIVKTQFGYHLIRLEERVRLPIILQRRWMLFPQFRERLLNFLNAR